MVNVENENSGLSSLENNGAKISIDAPNDKLPNTNPPKLSIIQLLNLCVAFLGIQFAWSMQIGLSGRVTEPLGATPIIFGLLWLAGPISGILVQPVVGAISDSIWTRFGRRRPFLIVGAILGGIALIAFPNASLISQNSIIPAIVFAAAFLWIIDASVNISQGPYRALVPDITPPEQQALANSFLSFAIGFGSVIAFATAPIVKNLTGYQMSIEQQFLMAAIALVVGILWTCITTPEKQKPTTDKIDAGKNKNNAFDSLKNFGISAIIGLVGAIIIQLVFQFDLTKNDSITTLLSWFVLILSVPMLTMSLFSFSSKEIYKLCIMQFFTWIGLMSMFIYFNNYVVHNVYMVPDLSTATAAVKAQFDAITLEATNTSSFALAVFNFVCLLVSIPIGVICSKLGKKNVHAFALAIMGGSFLGLAFLAKSSLDVYIFMGLAGIGWASVLALPFALLSEHIEQGTEGSAMGKFNLFIAGPQILSSVAVGYLITKSPLMTANGATHHWEYAFIVAGISLTIAAVIAKTVKEKNYALNSSVSGGAH